MLGGIAKIIDPLRYGICFRQELTSFGFRRPTFDSTFHPQHFQHNRSTAYYSKFAGGRGIRLPLTKPASQSSYTRRNSGRPRLHPFALLCAEICRGNDLKPVLPLGSPEKSLFLLDPP